MLGGFLVMLTAVEAKSVTDQGLSQSALTRREALKKGTLLGVGAIWMAPAAHTLQMSKQFAATTSGPSGEPRTDDKTAETNGSTPPSAVESVDSSDVLPFTGSDLARIGAMGVGMLAGGAALVKSSGRDTANESSAEADA